MALTVKTSGYAAWPRRPPNALERPRERAGDPLEHYLDEEMSDEDGLPR